MNISNCFDYPRFTISHIAISLATFSLEAYQTQLIHVIIAFKHDATTNCEIRGTHAGATCRNYLCSPVVPLISQCTVTSWLSHWGRVTYICVVKLTIIDSDNGLSPGRHQAIIWINVGILLIASSGTNFNEILIGIQTFSFKKMHLKMSSAK